ncbi:MAG: rhodanese-like domain-containing protein [Candidatus Thiodiazotropha sp.]
MRMTFNELIKKHIPLIEEIFPWDLTEEMARGRRLVVVCRSGNRSVLAAHTLQLLGFTRTASLKTGLKGWNDYDQPLVDERGESVGADIAEKLLNPMISLEKLGPRGR